MLCLSGLLCQQSVAFPPCQDLIRPLEVITFPQGGNLAAYVAFGSLSDMAASPRHFRSSPSKMG